MTSLRCLWLGDNQITKLPPKFGQLHNLDWGATGRHMLSSIIDGNPLQEPPIHVCRQGVIAIAQYFGDTGMCFARDMENVWMAVCPIIGLSK